MEELVVMRKMRSFIFAIIAITSVSAIGVIAQTPSAASAQTIERQVYKKLRGLPYYGVFDNITASVNGSTVTLYGKVITLGTKSAAARVVGDIPGVAEVVNRIEDLPPSGVDNRIRLEAYRTFVNRGPAQYFSTINPDVRIIVEHGRITLEGFVSRQSDSDLLNILANGISGVFKVTNNLVVGKRAA